MRSLKSIKILGMFLCLIIFASNVRTMARWSEARGVHDDICYLRQAHLFQRFGLRGIDTNLAENDDGYVSSKLKEIGFSTWEDPMSAPCHVWMKETDKLVLQYPPGTGFLLAIFPAGFQVVPLYVSAMFAVMLCAFAAIRWATTPSSIIVASVFGCATIYFMVNPAKSSYSIAPTMAACALAGLLTAKFFNANLPKERLLFVFMLGLLLGVSVNFRIPNLFLAVGYCVFFLVAFISSGKLQEFLEGTLFGASLLVGLVPTLLANAMNAGSPLSTTYGPNDVVPMDWTFSILPQYLKDLQGSLLILVVVWTAAVIFALGEGASRIVAFIVVGNLAVGLTYFMTHPIFTPYYIIPLEMLSLWSLLFAALIQDKTLPSSNLA